ncbi:MAG: class I poly(R)-hydroxyalkanoic acid synthase [Rhodospirillales bacterium]|nr:class I poly(R)-hydroxyalkanoic acid synthase [Rhodospirillales bacterium]
MSTTNNKNKKGETDQPGLPDLTESMTQLAAGYGRAMNAWMEAWSPDSASGGAKSEKSGEAGSGKTDRDTVPAASPLANAKLDPAKVMDAQMELWRGYQSLWLNTTQRLFNQEADAQPVVGPEPGDNRFKDPAWEEHPIFDYFKQSYLLNANWLKRLVGEVDGLEPEDMAKMEFYSRQIVDALSPSNFALTNPVVVRETAESNGENLVNGFKNLMEDFSNSDGTLSIKQADMDAFEVGKNVAVSEGGVVFQNEFFQLVQYNPTTEKVYAKPLLIVPPWINKFYILDLRPDNSFIRWATDRGYSVFVMSWVNPDETMAGKSFDDYIRDGIFSALDAVEQATGERRVTAIGYCIGGTLLAATLAYMAAHGDDRITAATFFAAQVDFEEAGELKLFTDKTQVDALEKQVAEKGYLDGASMASTFNMLRANDLIWYFVVNNYLLGKAPPAFDLLFWNADSTRFPAALLMDYLRDMYQDNKLSAKNRFEVLGEPVDLSAIKIPIYLQASKEDHIAPAASVFKATGIYGGPVRFVLAGSGHIAGVINSPEKQKYQHWTNTKRKSYGTFDEWYGEAAETPGSWWPDWDKWLSRKSGNKVAARKPGAGKLKVIEPAPGSYVKVKS